MSINIINYNDLIHRNEVIEIWSAIFSYKEKRNDPVSSIDRKLAVKDNLFFVATENDHVIGTIMAGYDGHRGWIYSLAVVPEKREMHVGTLLLKYAENALKKQGCVKINLQILFTNMIVKDFYIKNGYKVEERISMGKEL